MPKGERVNPVIDALEIEVDYEHDRMTIHAPHPIKVVQRQTNDMVDGITVIFESRRPGEL